jgi:hypothetical protein
MGTQRANATILAAWIGVLAGVAIIAVGGLLTIR